MLRIKNLFFLFISLISIATFANEVPQMSQQALLIALQQPNHNIVVLDVRSEEEYKEGHLAQAINFSHDTVEEKLTQLAQYKDKKVVVYCRSGRRAGIAEKILSDNGFSDLHHLTGDMNGWLEAQLPVVTNEHQH